MIDAELNRRCMFDQGYERYKKLNNAIFGECVILRNKNQHEVVLKNKTTNSRDEFMQDLKILSHRKTIKHDNLVKLLDYSARKRSDFCSTYYISNAFYEYFPTNLRDQIILRRKNNQFFTEKELVGFLYDILDVLAFLQGKNTTHGDIRPELIYFEEQNGKTISKLGDRLSEARTSNEC